MCRPTFISNCHTFQLIFVIIYLCSLLSQLECSEDTCKSSQNSNCSPGEGCCSTNSTKLLLVQVIFRHGDRTPLFPYPKDPHKASSVLKHFEQKGVLTRNGKIQGYELGKYLRSRYKEFLNETLIPHGIRVQSSEVERSIMTAQTLLAGLFPPCDDHLVGCESRWSREIKWQPIPVFPLPRELDNKLNFRRESCPAYMREFKKVLNCDLIKEFVGSHQETFEYLEKHTGLPDVNFENVGQIYDTLFIEELYELPLPTWTAKVYPEPLKTIQALGFQVVSGNREMMKFHGGPLLKEVLGNMKKSIQMQCSTDKETSRKKLYLYSGHDTTVAAFLSTLNSFDIHQPPYVSAVMVELHEATTTNGNGKHHLVKMFYRNSTKEPPQEIIMPECGNPCHLDNLTGIVRDLLIQDWKGECNKHPIWSWITRPFTTLIAFIGRLLRRITSACGSLVSYNN